MSAPHAVNADPYGDGWLPKVRTRQLPVDSKQLVSGDRAAELGLRCVYGGFPEEALEVEPDLAAALDRGLELTPAGGELVVLPTYTAMLRLQRIVTERGLAQPYWERS